MSAEKENIITYHIYAKDRCLYHNLKQEEFEETMGTTQRHGRIAKDRL